MTVISLHPRTATTVAGGEVVLDPIHAITTRMCYSNLHGWQQTRTPQNVAAVLVQAAQIACDYFGQTFPVSNVVSRP